jgi:predicted transglutaminase-like cysteine proteinase
MRTKGAVAVMNRNLTRTLAVAGIVAAVLSGVADAGTASGSDTPVTHKRNWLQRLFFKPSWEVAVSEASTPKEICRMVERHVGYQEELVDQWSAAQDTWKKGSGDCEDFAIAVQELCRAHGIEASVELYYPLAGGSVGHAVVVGTWNGRKWVSSNGSYEEMDSQEEIAKRVAQILWCKPDRMYSVTVADADVQNLTQGTGTVPAPVAAAGSAE